LETKQQPLSIKLLFSSILPHYEQRFISSSAPAFTFLASSFFRYDILSFQNTIFEHLCLHGNFDFYF